MDESLAGLLCYLFGFITGIIFLLIEIDNRFMRFHALQLFFTFAAIVSFSMVINVIPLMGMMMANGKFGNDPDDKRKAEPRQVPTGSLLPISDDFY